MLSLLQRSLVVGERVMGEGESTQENFSRNSELGMKENKFCISFGVCSLADLQHISCWQSRRKTTGTCWPTLEGLSNNYSWIPPDCARVWHRARKISSEEVKTLSAEVMVGEAERSGCAFLRLLALGSWAGCLKGHLMCHPVSQHQPQTWSQLPSMGRRNCTEPGQDEKADHLVTPSSTPHPLDTDPLDL